MSVTLTKKSETPSLKTTKVLVKAKEQNTQLSSERKRLGNYLVDAGLLTQKQINEALNEQKSTGKRLGEVISSHGWTNQQTIEYMMEKVVLPEQQLQDSGISPVMALNQMITATWTVQSIYLAASLGIADLLKDGPKSVNELAHATDSQAPYLYRVLRALASVGVFIEISPHQFALTEMAQYLRSDIPGSLRYISMMSSDQWHWNSLGDILHVVKTGQPAMQHLYQVDNTFEYLSQNPTSGAIFNNAMTGWSKTAHIAVVDAYDFSGVNKIVDVAGGHGTLIAAILAANPKMEGVLFDVPHVVADARNLLDREGVIDRCKIVGGDFFEAVPFGGNAYIMSHIVHDWGDEDCIKFLRNIRQSIAENGRLLVVEMVIPSGNTPHFGKLMDICMMTMYSAGRERTEAEYRQLFQAAGFRLTQIIPTASPMSVIEGVCA